MQWTVDTWLLVRANQLEEPGGPASAGFLLNLLSGGDKIALSDEVKMEYKKKALALRGSFTAQWYQQMWDNGMVVTYDAPEEKKAARLRERLAGGPPKIIGNFDRDDIPFVVLCFRTPDRHLISGDIGEGDYSSKLTGWLHKEYSICFHDLAEEAPYHRPRHGCTRGGRKGSARSIS